MNRRRYDEVIALVASVLFGVAVQDYKSIADGLRALAIPLETACFASAAMFLVFFRNIHGLFAYDAWAENHAYHPPFEDDAPRRLVFFLFALFGALLAPYFAVFCLKYLSRQPVVFLGITVALKQQPWQLYTILSLPLLIYVPWNLLWLYELHEPAGGRWKTDGQREAHAQLLRFTWRWVFIDWVGIVLWVLLWLVICRHYRSPEIFCWIFAVLAAVTIASDYLTHLEYYFPVKVEPTD